MKIPNANHHLPCRLINPTLQVISRLLPGRQGLQRLKYWTHSKEKCYPPLSICLSGRVVNISFFECHSSRIDWHAYLWLADRLICNIIVHLCIMLTFALQTGTNCEIKQFSCGNVFKIVHTKEVTHFSWLHSSTGHHRQSTSTVSLNLSSFTVSDESCLVFLSALNGIIYWLSNPLVPAKTK